MNHVWSPTLSRYCWLFTVYYFFNNVNNVCIKSIYIFSHSPVTRLPQKNIHQILEWSGEEWVQISHNFISELYLFIFVGRGFILFHFKNYASGTPSISFGERNNQKSPKMPLTSQNCSLNYPIILLSGTGIISMYSKHIQ